MFRNLKIRTKISITFFIAGLILTSTGVGVFYYFSADFIRSEVYDQLEAIAQLKATHVETFLNGKRQAAEQLSASFVIEDLLSIDKDNLEYNDKLEIVNHRLEKTVDFVAPILNVSLLDKNGIVIASTASESIGIDYSYTDYFQRTKKETSFELIEGPGGSSFFGVGAPVKDSQTGEFLGLVGVNINLEELNKILLDKAGLGETGETYLINKEGYALTPLLSAGEFFSRQKIDTVNSKNCLGAESKEHVGHEAVDVFLDYSGKKVVGSHIYIPEIEWCLLAEMD